MNKNYMSPGARRKNPQLPVLPVLPGDDSQPTDPAQPPFKKYGYDNCPEPDPASEAVLPVATPDAPDDDIPLSQLSPDTPDPGRPFWWFSNTPLSNKKISAGCAIEEPCGTRLPLEADYWCHEGDAEWVKVDRAVRPKPPIKKRTARKKARAPK
jgi:hypothetical protein